MSEQRPATDLLLARLANDVRQLREHDHPTKGADYFCLNLTSYLGEYVPALLKRIEEEQVEVRKWRDRHTALAEEAAGYLELVAELEVELAQERGEA